MSGLEPLAIFGIACNVMQTISFAQLAIATYKQIREDGSIDPQLHKAASELQTGAATLSTSIQGSTAQDAELVKTAKKCSSAAQKIVDELNKLAPGVAPGRQSFRKTISLGLNKLRKKGEIDRLEEEMNRVQGVMETRILIHTWFVLSTTRLHLAVHKVTFLLPIALKSMHWLSDNKGNSRPNPKLFRRLS